MIREAVTDDVNALVELGIYAHGEGPFSSLPYDETSIRRSALLSINMPNMCCFVADNDGVNGVLIGVIAPNIWGHAVATDMGMYATKVGDGAWLSKAFRKWAIENHAQVIARSNTYGDPAYDHMLDALGMETTGYQHIEVLQ